MRKWWFNEPGVDREEIIAAELVAQIVSGPHRDRIIESIFAPDRSENVDDFTRLIGCALGVSSCEAGALAPTREDGN